ncbi:MAG: hypothetical protein ACO1SX_05205, partial [Actinomycetota bacterium]
MRKHSRRLIAVIGVAALASGVAAQETRSRAPHRDSISTLLEKSKQPGVEFTGMAPPLLPTRVERQAPSGARPAESAERIPGGKAAGAQSAATGPRM